MACDNERFALMRDLHKPYESRADGLSRGKSEAIGGDECQLFKNPKGTVMDRGVEIKQNKPTKFQYKQRNVLFSSDYKLHFVQCWN